MAKVATVSLYEAKTRLSHLVDRALQGDEVVITRHGRPVARLVPARPAQAPRKLGALRGKIRIAEDFDAPLPDALLVLFEGRRGVSQRLLLDTHALLWALSAPRRLPARVAKAVRDPTSEVYVSAVATWEIAIKSALGKIDVEIVDVARGSRDAGFEELPVTIAHTVRLRTFPPHHRDPFDRLLVAQAVEEGLTVVTHDSALARYPVSVLWS